ncbi:MAG: YhcH/YjgK/YiaL family protein [Spirochaetales bacterium]|jgi:YhcH/YjgK/YiaL family protein|nr:YhcH/YjgK/YiaL family protein [Spirochaetales bacterium]
MMIYDQTKRIASYKGISKNLDLAIDYLLKNDIAKLPDGKQPVVGEDTVIAQVSRYDTKNLSDARFEAHKKYIDIQILLAGREGCYYLPLEGLVEDGPFIPERDIGFYKGENKINTPLEAGMFAMFFPHDAHKPSCDLDGKKSKNHKVILKVLV